MIRRIEKFCLDIGNGFTKATNPKGDVAIPAYVVEKDLPTTNIFSNPLGFYIEVLGEEGEAVKTFAVGETAISSSNGSEQTNGLYQKDKTDFYLLFLASLFTEVQDRSVSIGELHVSLPPLADGNALKAALVGLHKLRVNGVEKSLNIVKVDCYVENDPSGVWIANKMESSPKFLLVQCGRGTTHMGLFNQLGNRIGDVITLGGESKLMKSVQDSLRTKQNLAPSLEDIMQAYLNPSENVWFNGRSYKWVKVFDAYRKQRSKMFAELFLQNFQSMNIQKVYFVGGAAETFKYVGKMLKGVDVKFDSYNDGTENQTAQQFIELEGLKLIANFNQCQKEQE